MSVTSPVKPSIKSSLKPADIKQFTERSNTAGWWMLIVNWGLVAIAFALPIIWFHPITLVVSVVLLANRQLGLSILMHECAHYSLFESRQLNQNIGNYLCAAPVLASLDGYRKYHMDHHKLAGTDEDPDYANYKNYPVSKASMTRKILRDLIGLTAIKTLYATVLMRSGVLDYDLSYQNRKSVTKPTKLQMAVNLLKSFAAPIAVHLALFSLLAISGNAAFYGLWWISYLTLYMLFLRIRNAAEHGSVPDLLNTDPLLHARTTYASWWERLTVAPNYVNFHMEHHLRPSVPCYQLAAFHGFLKEKGIIERAEVADGYPSVMRALTQ